MRLSKVLLKDKEIPRDFAEVFAAEVKSVLNAYFEVPKNGITVELTPFPDGVRVNIEALANRIKPVNFI